MFTSFIIKTGFFARDFDQWRLYIFPEARSILWRVIYQRYGKTDKEDKVLVIHKSLYHHRGFDETIMVNIPTIFCGRRCWPIKLGQTKWEKMDCVILKRISLSLKRYISLFLILSRQKLEYVLYEKVVTYYGGHLLPTLPWTLLHILPPRGTRPEDWNRNLYTTRLEIRNIATAYQKQAWIVSCLFRFSFK